MPPLDSDGYAKLQSMARSISLRSAIAARARIILACAANEPNAEIAERLALSKATVGKWRNRFIESGCAGLYDKPRPGKPPIYDREKIAARLDEARRAPALAAPRHWSIRALASELGLSKSSVHRYLRKLAAAGSVSVGMPFVRENLRNVAGLYLNPPDDALILGIGKQTDFSGAADKGRERLKEMDRLAGALNAAPRVTRQKSVIRQRHHELSEFLKHIEEIVADDLEIHVIADNASMCAHPKIKAWIASRPRWSVHVVPASGAWLPLVERIFQIAGDGESRRERVASGKEIGRKIASFITNYDKKTRPFLWMKPVESAFQ
jgi:putative transposase